MINSPFPIVWSSLMQCFARVKTCILLPARTGQQLTQHSPQHSKHVDIPQGLQHPGVRRSFRFWRCKDKSDRIHVLKGFTVWSGNTLANNNQIAEWVKMIIIKLLIQLLYIKCREYIFSADHKQRHCGFRHGVLWPSGVCPYDSARSRAWVSADLAFSWGLSRLSPTWCFRKTPPRNLSVEF